MPSKRKKPGPKPLTVSLHPLTWYEAMSAFMQVDPEKIRKKEKRWRGRKRKRD